VDWEAWPKPLDERLRKKTKHRRIGKETLFMDLTSVEF
jgi:hypothetical protein